MNWQFKFNVGIVHITQKITYAWMDILKASVHIRKCISTSPLSMSPEKVEHTEDERHEHSHGKAASDTNANIPSNSP
jgi:hypothetical protein